MTESTAETATPAYHRVGCPSRTPHRHARRTGRWEPAQRHTRRSAGWASGNEVVTIAGADDRALSFVEGSGAGSTAAPQTGKPAHEGPHA
jgi:hypothetical protein